MKACPTCHQLPSPTGKERASDGRIEVSCSCGWTGWRRPDPPPPNRDNREILEELVVRPGDLWVDYMDLDEIVFAERNPKGHDLGLLDHSIGRHGFVEPPTLNETTGRLVAGHGRIEQLRARRDRGEDPPPQVRPDGARWLVPVVRGNRWDTDAEAEAYLVTSNRLTELGGWDADPLLEVLDDLVREDLLEGTGYDLEDVELLRAGDAGPASSSSGAGTGQGYRLSIACEDGGQLEAVTEAVRDALRDRWPDLRLKVTAPSE